ncbi:Copper-transporting P-type ATPase [Carnimonas sp. R-84981]|uniref:heavy metal translocating P-type ATPase n=1 Tax=Carnimonas bestiolae TaxID=3402172 RepID=UPI003EDC027F
MSHSSPSQQSQQPSLSVTFDVEGMHCASCVKRIESALGNVADVEEVRANVANGRVSVFSHTPVDSRSLKTAIDDAGFSASTERIELAIEGMHCASCVSRVEQALAGLPGVIAASVNLATERAQATVLSGAVSRAQLASAVRKTGYQVAAEAQGQGDQRERQRAERAKRQQWLLVLAISLTVPLFIIAMSDHLVAPFHHWLVEHGAVSIVDWIQAVLATLVLFVPGAAFFRSGLTALLRRTPDMNSLVAVGAGTAWLYSLVVLLFPQWLPAASRHLYFEPAAMIVTLVMIGRFFEARAKGRSSSAVRALVNMQVPEATVIREGVEQTLAIEQIAVGDLLIARPGERIAVDGTVEQGESWVDESLLSGESAPQHKQAGSRVVAATINGAGSFRYRATQVGDDTTLAHITRIVEQAQAAKLPIQSLVDRISAVFVPAVLVLAVIVLAIWLFLGATLSMAISVAVAVVIISCPCAMGLATPVSIMVASGRAARLGILLRSGEALQTLDEVRVVALDKTGTLTEGHPSLSGMFCAPDVDKHQLLGQMSALEKHSEHPLAEAIVAAAPELAGVQVERVQVHAGEGISGRVDGHALSIGREAYISARASGLEQFASQTEQQAGGGASLLYVALDEQVVALLTVDDAIKSDSRATVAALKKRGIQVVMISGDAHSTAHHVARQLGIDEIQAPLLPAEKASAIEALHERYGAVAFVGDGINDAPALAAADVGIAIGSGADVAIETADIVLVSGNTEGVQRALALGHATLVNIRQNLAWAFGYNLCLIPLAAGVLYPAFGILLSPVFAALAMTLSSLFVLSNALRLQRFQR